MQPSVQTLKGFRDFLPAEKRQRDFVLQKIIAVFERFGFEPLETPTLEYASLLLGKYGDEADKLVYTFTDQGDRKVGLRYDQTVPTARVLTQYQSQLPKFFRRYQIQNVFRADKPQKGRFREFTQCDIDIFGSTSPLSDADIIACTYASFQNIGFPTIQIKYNDRQILFQTLNPYETSKVPVLSLIQSIDKLDKKPPEEIVSELVKKGLTKLNAQNALKDIQSASPSPNLQTIISAAINLGVPAENLIFTPELARGLDYYTGIIFEVIVPEYPVGSFAGGGRYDNLIKQLGGQDTSAVGIAFGFDRLVEAAVNLNLIPREDSSSKALVTVFAGFEDYSLVAARKLRSASIKTEIYPQATQLAKQLKFANQKGIPYVIVIGEEEAKQDKLTLKNMQTGQQQLCTIDEAVSALTS